MKILRRRNVPRQKRPMGRTVQAMLRLRFSRPVRSLVVYLNSLPDGKFDRHRHARSREIICFPEGGRISINGKDYRLRPWDMALIDKGDVHGNMKKSRAIRHLVIKFPDVRDKKNV